MDNDNFIEDDLAILAEFVDESESDLDKIGNKFVDLENSPDNQELINSIFRPIHSIKGNSAFLGLMRVRQLAHEMETLLDDFRKQRSKPDRNNITVLLRGVDTLKLILSRIRKQAPELDDEPAFQSLIKDIRELQVDETEPSTPTAPTPPAKTDASPPTPASRPRGEFERTIRIPESFLDEFKSFQDQLAKVKTALENPDIAKKTGIIGESAAALGQISAAMQQQIDAFMAVPVGDLLNRAPRIARETAAVTEKNVKVNLSGEDLCIPKSLIETLESPLMHIVRNAVDHGIESPETRRRAGKNETGQIRLEASADNGQFVLRITDDGAGIDFKTLLSRAMAQGTCPRNRALTPDDIMNLVFLPGVTAAKKVTDISGRGVGMDVVKSKIEEAGGKISLSSKTGKGSEFTIRMPLG